ncbi:hypothetical protein LTR86_001280 [Recurvomyces mirabilis]|nr:hypothetical protein LTR86_001280 [Recurvomyces mirabilis]
MKTILVVGGTGAQGGAVVRHLCSTGRYRILLFTRDLQSKHSTDLIKLGNVEGVRNGADHGYDVGAYEQALHQVDGVFINTDGFALGEQAETYWGIRLFEVAVKAGVPHIVYSGLENSWRESSYDPALYVGHYQGKARVQDFIKAQPPSKTKWSIVRSGPYIEMLAEALVPSVDDNGTYTFNLPLDNGAIPFIHLEDFGRYIDWILSHLDEASNLDLAVSTTHATGEDIAQAFTAVTGKKAIYSNIPASIWSSIAFESLPDGPDTKVGYNTMNPNGLNQTYAENFGNWWNLYKASAGNTGLIKKDYALLDKLLPDRVKSVQEWMVKTNYTGERVRLLKMAVTNSR